MRRLFLTIIVTLMAFGYSWAGDYERYYQNLPTKVTPVTTFSLPENQVSLTDFGGIGDGGGDVILGLLIHDGFLSDTISYG